MSMSGLTYVTTKWARPIIGVHYLGMRRAEQRVLVTRLAKLLAHPQDRSLIIHVAFLARRFFALARFLGALLAAFLGAAVRDLAFLALDALAVPDR